MEGAQLDNTISKPCALFMCCSNASKLVVQVTRVVPSEQDNMEKINFSFCCLKTHQHFCPAVVSSVGIRVFNFEADKPSS